MQKRSEQLVRYSICIVILLAFMLSFNSPQPAQAGSIVVSSNQTVFAQTGQKPDIATEPKEITEPKDQSKEDDLSFLEEEPEEEIVLVPDPIEGLNRTMFVFNDKLYFWVIKPVASAYGTIMPEIARVGIKNFIYNVTFPIRFVNSLLQGRWKKAESEFSRFMICTSFGVLGFGNPVKDYPELNPSAEDMGQTFGAWGIDNGFYIVWPLMGPSTFRDSVGRFGDWFLDPTFIVDRFEVTIALRSVEAVNNTSFRIGDYEALKEAALDPYVALRNAYIQNRNKRIQE